MSDHDYIVVGGGSAGCVMAEQLSEMPASRVLLLAAGPRDTNPYILIPARCAKTTSGKLRLGYATAPLRHANNCAAVYPQARVLGGDSSINVEVFTRGSPEDCNSWADGLGCEGWVRNALKPHFLKSEGNTRLGRAEHGTNSPLALSDLRSHSPLSEGYVDGCVEIGMPRNYDFNSGKQAGAGVYQTTTKSGWQYSAASGYRKPAHGRSNPTLRT